MKILVLSDTHCEPGEELPAAVLAAAATADLIIHAGDLVHPGVVDALRAAGTAAVEAVAGNMDSAAAAAQYPAKKLLTLGRFRVGITHGSGAPAGVGARALGMFPGADVVIHGHTHQPVIEDSFGTLLLNPGSPTDNRYAPYHSFAWLHLDDATGARAEIVRLEA